MLIRWTPDVTLWMPAPSWRPWVGGIVSILATPATCRWLDREVWRTAPYVDALVAGAPEDIRAFLTTKNAHGLPLSSVVVRSIGAGYVAYRDRLGSDVMGRVFRVPSAEAEDLESGQYHRSSRGRRFLDEFAREVLDGPELGRAMRRIGGDSVELPADLCARAPRLCRAALGLAARGYATAALEDGWLVDLEATRALFP